MPSTLARQHRLFPTSGDTLTGNGDPMSTRVPYDLIQGVNNLMYTQPWLAYCASPETDGRIVIDAGAFPSSSEEVFLAQFPTVLPDGPRSLHWTLGLYATDGYDGVGPDVTYDAVNVYVSPVAYAGVGVLYEPFDVTRLGGTYFKSASPQAIAVTGTADHEYHFIDASAGTTGTVVPFDRKYGNGWLNRCHIIVTLEASVDNGVDPLEAIVDLASFSSWVTWEQ